MANEQGSPDVSAEAFERVTRERDALKEQAQVAARALKDTQIERKLIETFSAKGYANPLAVASRALPEFREVPDEELAARAESWYDTQRKLFAAPDSPEQAPVSEPSPWSQAPANPVPTGGKVPAATQPMRADSQEYAQWVQGKSFAEVKAAVAANEVVIPDKVKTTQRTIPFGGS